MTLGNSSEAHANSAPLYSAVITPHRSLGRNGFLALMAAMTLVSFAAGVFFVMLGAWPVFGFFGLDVLLLYGALRLNYRHAAAFEEIVVTPTALRLRQVTYRGEASEWDANPLWTRLAVSTDGDDGVQSLHLMSRGEAIAIAGFLGPAEKAKFATSLQQALNAARRGPDAAILT